MTGRSPGEGNGKPLPYSCLENSMDRGVWWAMIHDVAKSQTRLSDFCSLICLFTNRVMLGKLLSFSDSCLVACVCVCWSLGRVQLFVTPRTVARQSPLSMEFSRQEYWGGLPCSPPGDLPDPGMEPRSSALQANSLPCVTREAPLSRLVVSDSATPCTVARQAPLSLGFSREEQWSG